MAVLALPEAAYAAANGSYADWSRSGSSGAWQATGTPAAGFPVAEVASNASTVAVPSGANTFLGPQTPPGQAYGSSQGHTYLNVSTATGFDTSTTTVAFDPATPAKNWAFVIGDLDADTLTISATDANGDPVSPADLGFQGAFNYCAYAPKPAGCTGPGPFTDLPTWSADTSTLVGNTLDTFGAAAWFQPTAAIKTLTLRFSRLLGAPIYQLWLAAKAVPVEVPVTGATDDCPATVELDNTDGSAVLGADGKPVTATTGAGGVATFDAVTDGTYQLHMRNPKCGKTIKDPYFTIVVDTSKGPVKVPAGTFVLDVPELASTGQHTARLLLAGAIILVSGALLVFAGRRRTR
ncbi:LPXTG cell wall anchor domain-containing protein [Hamadaea sp. NPDC051192]|uniref:LPXTG cell wall anchor domain-containing protein n=1 Tax=Hamadaea sp. NPDC051192 TaxID=3154940 RepID=UPI00343EB165